MGSLSKINVLVTGGGAPGAAGIIKSIRESGDYHIVAGDVKEHCAGEFLADDYVRLPLAIAENFAEEVLDICKEKNIRIILPLVTKELPLFAEHKNNFQQQGITAMVSSPKALQIANDKGALYDFFKSSDFIPLYKRCADVKELMKAIIETGYPQSPVCFKPCLSNGSRGFRIIDENKDRFQLLFNEKPGLAYTTLKEVQEILYDKKIPELLVSEFLPGDEYSVDAFCDEGKLIIALPRKRKKMIGGISVEGNFENNLILISYTESIVGQLRLHGNIGLQFKKSKEGSFKLLEINPRLQGTTAACLGAGVNMVRLALDYATGKKLDIDFHSINWYAKFIRFWDEVFYN